MGSHTHFARIPFEDFLSYLFNSSTVPRRNPKHDRQELIQGFVNMGGSTKVSSQSKKLKSIQSNLSGRTGTVSTDAGSNAPRMVPTVSSQRSQAPTRSSHLPYVVSMPSTADLHGNRNVRSFRGNDRDGSFELPRIETLEFEHFDVDNDNNNFTEYDSPSSRGSRGKRSSGCVDELAFYKNFSAHYGKSRAKSMSSSEVNVPARLCRSAPVNHRDVSRSTSDLDQDELMEFEYADLFNSTEDAAEFLRLHPDFPRSHHEYEAADEVMDLDGSQRSGLYKSAYNMPSTSASAAGEKIMLALHPASSAKYQGQEKTDGKGKSVDLTLNERVEKTMSLYLDAVKMGQRKEYEDSSTSVRLFY